MNLEEQLSRIGLEMGFEVRNAINNMPHEDRTNTRKSILKGEKTKKVDAIGEEISIKYLERLAKEQNIRVRLIIEPNKNSFYDIGQGNIGVNVYLDPVDGTIKLAGLGNDGAILRMVNDGVWGFGVSFTSPTDKEVKDLQIKDFIYSTLVDGNPSEYSAHPSNAFSKLVEGKLRTSEMQEKSEVHDYDELKTSSQTNIPQGIIGWDAFQGFDRNSATAGTEGLILRVYEKVVNRNTGGAFDLWRIYGDFGDILRGHFGYEGLEPQGVARFSFNNHLGNAVPVYSVYKGAGGSVVDFKGEDIGERKISWGRTNMVFAANKTVEQKLLALINS